MPLFLFPEKGQVYIKQPLLSMAYFSICSLVSLPFSSYHTGKA